MKRQGRAAVLVGLLAAMPAGAQVRTIDPNQAGTLAAPPAGTASAPVYHDEAPPRDPDSRPTDDGTPAAPPSDAAARPAPPPSDVPPPLSTRAAARADVANTYRKQDVLVAAEGVFGKGAAGLAGLIEKVFRDQGEPTGYIAGREAGGAFMVGVRYGSGTLFHKVEGQRRVNWTGPSLGFDVGGNAAKSFVLVYNLFDTQDLFHRFPAVEGNAYVIGGFTASFLKHGPVMLVPIRLGVGARLGANVGYMRFTEKPHWVPF